MGVGGQHGFRIPKYKSHIFCALQLQRVRAMSACSSHAAHMHTLIQTRVGMIHVHMRTPF